MTESSQGLVFSTAVDTSPHPAYLFFSLLTIFEKKKQINLA
jgi:hypothetical protein